MRTLDSLVLEVAEVSTPDQAGAIVVCDDPTGSLTTAALGRGGPVFCVDSDYSRAHAAHAAGAQVAGIDGPLRADAFLSLIDVPFTALGEMPKSLGRLDYLARAVAGAAAAAGMPARLVFGGNNKHLSRSMNDVLAESFTEVSASRGRGKFRCLTAAGPRAVTYAPIEAGGYTAFGGVFAGAREDHGGALLADALLDDPQSLGRVLDLGCGNGSVAKRLLDAGAEVTATDSDADAVLSARALLDCEVTWDDAGSAFPDGSFDTVALNPPFHDRAGVDATLVQHLLDASVRLLAPGGSLFMVHNSHLRYRGEVEARFGHVAEIARNPKFTVLRARR